MELHRLNSRRPGGGGGEYFLKTPVTHLDFLCPRHPPGPSAPCPSGIRALGEARLCTRAALQGSWAPGSHRALPVLTTGLGLGLPGHQCPASSPLPSGPIHPLPSCPPPRLLSTLPQRPSHSFMGPGRWCVGADTTLCSHNTRTWVMGFAGETAGRQLNLNVR